MARFDKRRKVKLGLLGSGIVGEAIQDIFFAGQSLEQIGIDLEISKIYTRHPKKKKWFPSHRSLFTDQAEEVINHPETDIIIEVLGFQEEKELNVFKEYFIQAFKNGKPVVTSDKAVLAKFGKELWAAAERYGQELRFEATVGGGIPIIRSLTKGFAAEEPGAVYGIINGTCNYILSEMKKSGKSYSEALGEAQALGFAESNPKSDTNGSDAEAKLILLTAVTFGLHTEPGSILRKGIEEIQAIDFLYADRKGRATIKQLAVAKAEGDSIQVFVSPVLVPHDHFLSTIDGPTNAIFFKGKRSGGNPATNQLQSRDWDYVLVGPGAGGGPTAVAVMSDVCELASGSTGNQPGLRSLVSPGTFTVQSEDSIASDFYVRFLVKDRAGIVGEICQTFGKAGINIAEIWQLNHSIDEKQSLAKSYRLAEKPKEILPFGITLERATVGQIKKTLEIIRAKDYILVDPLWLPIWNIEK